MAPNPALVGEHADMAERLHEIGGPPLSVEFHTGDTAEQRASLLEHHQAIQDELRRRGWIVQAATDRDGDVERFLVRMAPEE